MKSTIAKGLRVIAVGLPLVTAAAMPASCVTSNSGGGPDAGTFNFDAATSSSSSSGGSSSSSSGSSSGSSSSSSSSGSGGDAGSCGTGFVSNGGVCYVNLQGSWSPTTDSNSNGPDTVGTLGTNTTTSVSVVQSHTGTSGADCGCNGLHLQIPLGKTFQCASTTLAFDWATTTTQTTTNNPAVDIRFCTGPCNTFEDGGGPTFYGGPQYAGGAFAGQSSCGYEFENDAGTASLNSFPASAVMAASNTVALSSYVAPSSQDDCTGSFDTIDVHMQVYNCFATETGTDTLSNLRVY
jgi:hypothetical protein